jgi:hypothetical protein
LGRAFAFISTSIVAGWIGKLRHTFAPYIVHGMMSFRRIADKKGLDKDFCISCVGVRKWGEIRTEMGRLGSEVSNILHRNSDLDRMLNGVARAPLAD